MEPLTQATLGAAAAIALTRDTPIKHAFWMGALGGFIPDADVLIRSSSDPLLHLEYHRQFTHSIAFIPFGGALTAGLTYLITKARMSFKSLWIPATIGWSTHGVLDAFTSYGTQLLWPFSSTRIAWNAISVVDPLYTLPLVSLSILSLIQRNRSLSRLAILWTGGYLLLGMNQQNAASAVYGDIVLSRGHEASVLVKPSFGNNILFRGFYLYENQIYVDSIRVPWVGDTKIYEGSHIEQLDFEAIYSSVDSTHQNDLERFQVFSNGFLIKDPFHEGMIGDARYAMVPNTIAPIWGINFEGRISNTHMSFVRYSALSQTQRTEFYRQLWGE